MSKSSETFRLIQPGLMSIDELKDLLSQRGVSLKSHENKNKEELVDLYVQQVLPLSQRNFPNSHRGKIINKKIAAEELKQSKTESSSRNNFQYGFKDQPSGSSSKRHISNESSSSNSRYHLKPPIDTTSVPSKKICLSRTPSSDRELDKIVIVNRSKRHSESSCGSDKETSHKSEKQDSEKKSPVKSRQSSSKDSKERDKDEPPEKRKKIAWP